MTGPSFPSVATPSTSTHTQVSAPAEIDLNTIQLPARGPCASHKTLSSQTPSGAPPVLSHVRNVLREIVKVIQMEEYQYQDPVTTFLKELYIEFDFEAAHKALKKMIDVVGNGFKDELLDNARSNKRGLLQNTSEDFDFRDLAERLNLSRDREGEK